MEAVRTEGSSSAKNDEDRKREIRRELDRLTWQSYLELSLAGLPGLGWIWFGLSLSWCGVAISLPGYSHPSTYAHGEVSKEKLGLERHIIPCGCCGLKARWSGVTVVCCEVP